MTNKEVAEITKQVLKENGLTEWGVRFTSDLNKRTFLGLCSYEDKVIFFNNHHVNTHPDSELLDTIYHEVAHAILGPGKGHNQEWRDKAAELGCKVISECGMALDPIAIDAIRSGHSLEFEVIESEEIIHKREVKTKISKLTEKCPECGKVANVVGEFEYDGKKYITYECMHTVVKIIPKGTPYETIVFDGDPNCQHEWKRTVCKHCDAKRPYDFQIEGMRAIEKGLALHKGFGVFHEMGLGKTLMALGYVKFKRDKSKATLYITKAGAKYQLMKEIVRVLGPEYFPQVIATGKDYLMPGLKSYIASYSILRNYDLNKLKAANIDLVIIDECQAIKNPDSQQTKEVRNLCRQVDNVIPISGTPWKNRGSELFVVFNLLDSTKFSSYQRFIDNWVDFKQTPNGTYKEAGIRNIPRFKEYISDLCIRRERVEVMPELPLVSRTKIFCELNEMEQSAYDEAQDALVKVVNAAVLEGKNLSFAANGSVMAALNTMRQIVGVAKIPATIEYAETFLEQTDRKLTIFVHHILVGDMMMKLLEPICKEAGDIPLLRIVGGMDAGKRFDVQERFNNSPRAILIASELAAGEAINLQTCADCVMHERQWNPANEEQAEGRFIRIGQMSSTVTAQYIHAVNTCDQDLDGIVEPKRVNFNNVMNHEFEPNENNICKKCLLNEEFHKVHWDEGSIIQELVNTIVNNRNKNRRKKFSQAVAKVEVTQ